MEFNLKPFAVKLKNKKHYFCDRPFEVSATIAFVSQEFVKEPFGVIISGAIFMEIK